MAVAETQQVTEKKLTSTITLPFFKGANDVLDYDILAAKSRQE